ncbi:MAG: hypothetical protein EBR17_00575 [Betaproteobacteria bacterium]|jgi:hypothetical protein|nr:hypothetical protein [Betaproteobacteria bacterium]
MNIGFSFAAYFLIKKNFIYINGLSWFLKPHSQRSLGQAPWTLRCGVLRLESSGPGAEKRSKPLEINTWQ